MSDTVIVAPTAEASTTTATEVPSAPPETLKTPEPAGSAKLLELARRESSFLKKEVEYKQKIADYEKRVEELSYFQKAKDIAKANPEELLSRLGITYDELTQSLLDYQDAKEKGAKTPSVEELRKEIAKEFEQREAQKAKDMEQQVVQGFVKEIETFVTQNESKFPHLTKLSGPLGDSKDPNELIFEVVTNYFEETGELLDLNTAAATAEEYFREEWNKLNGILTGTPQASAPETKAEVSPVASSAPSAPAPVQESEGSLSASRFTRKDQTPSIHNGMRPTSRIPYRGNNVERRDVIAQAVAALEAHQKR